MGFARLHVASLLTVAFCDRGIRLVISLLHCQHALLGLTPFAPPCSRGRTLAWTPRERKAKPLAAQPEESEVCFVASSIQPHCPQNAPCKGGGDRELCFSFFKSQQVLDFRIWTLKGDPLTVASVRIKAKHTTPIQDILVMDLSA